VTLLLPLLAFVCVALFVVGAAMVLAPGGGGVIERRLGELRDMTSLPSPEGPAYSESLKKAMTRLGKYAPQSTSEMSKLKTRLVHAGYRGSEALPVFVGLRQRAPSCFCALSLAPS
jgi:hypothetical protein